MESTCLTDIANEILGQLSSLPLQDQNEIVETVARKLVTVRDRQVQDLEHKAMLIRNSSHEFKNKMLLLNHK